jgi:meiosis-specific transcription factor NDT80
VLQPPLPLGSENPFSSEQACIDQIGGHSHHNFAGVPDQLRRDGVLADTATGLHQGSLTGRYGTHRPDSA